MKYHDRMPVILDPGDYARWLDPTTPTDRLLPLLESRPANHLGSRPREDSFRY